MKMISMIFSLFHPPHIQDEDDNYTDNNADNKDNDNDADDADDYNELDLDDQSDTNLMKCSTGERPLLIQPAARNSSTQTLLLVVAR